MHNKTAQIVKTTKTTDIITLVIPMVTRILITTSIATLVPITLTVSITFSQQQEYLIRRREEVETSPEVQLLRPEPPVGWAT